MTSEFMSVLAEALAAVGIAVLRFDFPFTASGRKAPDRAPVLEAAWVAVVDYVTAHRGDARVAVGGKSMGGRIATQVLAGDHLASDVPEAAVMFGYPLHPPGKPDRLRDSHLAAVGVPVLFLQGNRDALGRIDLMEQAVSRMNRRSPQPAELHVIEDANHDFAVPKRTGRSRADVIAELASVTAQWLRSL